MNSRTLTAALLLLCFGLASCAAPGASSRKQAVQEAFDPSSLEDDDIVKEYPYPDALSPGQQPLPPPPAQPIGQRSTQESVEPSAGHQQVQGYRVQIFVSQERSKAEEMKRKAAATFAAPVYVDFEPPWYKIRIGDYQTEQEARSMLEEINARGYEWTKLSPLVVRTYIWKD